MRRVHELIVGRVQGVLQLTSEVGVPGKFLTGHMPAGLAVLWNIHDGWPFPFGQAAEEREHDAEALCGWIRIDPHAPVSREVAREYIERMRQMLR